MKLSILLLLVAFATALAIPHRRSFQRRQVEIPEKCSTRCTGVKNKFNYQVGKSYMYNYDSKSHVEFLGTTKDKSSLRQTAKVTISAVEPCEFTLQLNDVSIEGHNHPSWKRELEARPLRFSFDDGVIKEICPSEEDPAWALNIKRAILSTFQNALEGTRPKVEVYETDVSGKCPTTYELEDESRGQKIIKKSKDLISCEGHHENHVALRGVKYDVKSKLQNTPLTESTQECTHTIQRNLLQTAVCKETHNFRPFRKDSESGIITSAETKLEFQSENSNVVQSVCGSRKTLHFDHSEFSVEEQKEVAGNVRSTLRDLCTLSNTEIRPETPGLFTELIYHMRKVDYDGLNRISSEVARNSFCKEDKKFFFDALPMCGSEACVKIMVDALKSGNGRTEWITTFSMVPKPTIGMIAAVSELINTVDSRGLLGISSLVHGYCKENPACAETNEVSRILQTLTSKLGDKCTNVRDHTTKAVLILKALGNIGHCQSPIPTLLSCLREERNPIEIRLAAVQALRRMPCHGDQKSALLERFRDTTEEIEIRIWSFMTLMKCPSVDLVKDIKEVLNKETVTQVGSFVYSFIKAKGSTSDPCGRKLQHLLRHQRLNSKFNRDPRKFSRFYEMGTFMESTNLGGHMEGGLIMDPSGYLPRQGFMNLTVHLFGNSVNLLEIGGRTRGMERLVDKLFGSEGYFSSPSAYYTRDDRRKEHSNRRVKTIHDLFHRKDSFSEELALSMYVKLFGDDLAYYDIKKTDMIDEIRNMVNTEKLMEYLAKERTMKVSRNIMFLDTTVTIPTISGIPLRISVNGTASLHVEYGGKIDLTKLMQAPHNVHIKGSIAPSAAVELSSMVAMHVQGMKTGVKMVGRIHTSTRANGLLQRENGEFKTSLELPDNEMEIIDVQSQLFHIVGDIEEEASMETPQKEHEFCTCDMTGKITGLKLCSSVSYPRNSMKQHTPYMPLTGPMRARVILSKHDPTLTKYELTSKMVSTPSNYDYELSFNTPGSTVDREVVAKVQYKPDESMMASLKTPKKEWKVEGSMSKSQDLSQGQLSLKVDNRETYAVTAKIRETLQRGGMMHALEAEVKRPNQEDIKVTGNYKKQTMRFEVDFNVDGLYREPVKGKALWEAPETTYNKFNTEFMFKCPAIHIDMKANGKFEPTGNLDYKYSLEYKRKRDPTPHKITASQTQTMKKEGDMLKLHSISSFTSSWYPQYDSQSTYLLTKGRNLFENRLNIKYGAQKQTIDFMQMTKVSEGDKYTTDISFDFPQYNLKQEMKMIYQNRFPDMFEGRFEWPSYKNFVGELKLRNNKNELWNMEAEAMASYTGREIRIFKKIDEIEPKVYKSEALFQWQKNKKIEVDTDLKLKSQRGVYEYELNAVAKMSGQPESLTFRKSFKMSRTETKYVALARKGTTTVYDFKLDMIDESNTRKRYQAHLKSEALDNLDYAVAGAIEKLSSGSAFEAEVKKNRKEYMKAEIIVPKNLQRSNEVRIKGHLYWDMDTPVTKEVMGDYKLTKGPSTDRTHEWQMKVKGMGTERSEYHWHSTVKHSQYYSMNTTITKNNRPLIQANWGSKMMDSYKVDPNDIAIDFKIRTYEPLTPNHLVGLLTHKTSQNSFRTKGIIECLQHNRKAQINVEGKQHITGRRGRKWEWAMMTKYNEKELHMEEEISMPDFTDYSTFSGKTKYQIKWAGNKEIKYNREIEVSSQNSVLKINVQTPYRTLSNGKAEVRVNTPLTTPRITALFEWNNNKKVEARFNGDIRHNKALDLHAELTSTYENLEKLEAKLKYDYRSDSEVETYLKWNQDSRIQFVHKRVSTGQKHKYTADVECVVPERINIIGKGKIEYGQGEYEVDSRLNLGENNYKLTADLNKNTKSGSISLETPHETLNSANAKFTKLGPNEYKFESEKNGESNGAITVMAKMNDGDHEMKFEVDSVRYPFRALYKGQYTDNKWFVRTEVTLKEERKTYGLELSNEEKSAKKSESMLVVKHPKRNMMVKILKDNSDENTCKLMAEINPNQIKNRMPTRIMYVSKSEGRKSMHEMKVTDPSIPKGIKIIYKKDVEGECKDLNSECRHTMEVKVDYSGDHTKTLLAKSHILIEPSQSRGRMSNLAKMTGDFSLTHPASGLHAKAFVRSPNERTFETGFEYKDAQKQLKTYKISMEYSSDSTHSQIMTLNMENPSEKWTIQYRTLNSEDCQVLVLRNGKPTYDILMTLSEPRKLMRFEIRKTESSQVLFHVSAHLSNSDVARIRIWHTEEGRRLDDGEFTIKLDRADLLNTKFYVRPGFTKEFSQLADQMYRQYKKSDSRDLTKLGMGYYRTMKSSQDTITEDMERHMEPLSRYIEQEFNEMAKEFGPAMEELMSQSQLYMDLAKEFLFAFLDMVDMTVDQIMKTMPNESFRDYYTTVKQSMVELPETMGEMMGPVKGAWEAISETFSDVTDKMSEAKDWVSEKLDIEDAKQKVREMYREIQNSELMRKMREVYSDLISKATGLSPKEAYDRVYNTVSNSYSTLKDQGSDMWEEWTNWFLEYQLGQYLAEWAAEIGNKIQSTYTYVDAEDRIENVITWFRDLIASYNPNSDEGWNRYLPHIKTNDPETGNYEMNIPLPVKVHSLEHLVSQVKPEQMMALKEKMQSQINSLMTTKDRSEERNSDSGYSLWDTVYEYKPSSWQPNNWMPPYDSTAYIIGGHHFVTYDGHVYDFLAKCEYMLSRDFHDKKFTISASFDQTGYGRPVSLDTLKVHAVGHLIEIPAPTTGGKVKIDGADHELPWHKIDEMDGKIYAKVTKDMSGTTLTVHDGLKISCTENFFMCSITLPGSYHGKSAGLLGSNDNEPNNDMMDPEGNLQTDTDSFASSWHMGSGNCQGQRNSAPTQMVEESSSEYRECQRLFKGGNSPMRACFSQVNPEPYMRMCTIDSRTYSDARCNISAAYVEACDNVGINVEMPNDCASCGVPGSEELSEGDSARVEGSNVPKTVDIVFAVEERNCMKNAQQHIVTLGRNLERSLQRKTYNKFNFGVIGFSGEGVHYTPHFHTGDGSLTFGVNGLQEAVNELVFEQLTMAENTPIDPMVTLDFVADNFPWSPAAEKIVILLACTECNSNKIGFYELQNKLLEGGINLHVITNKDIEITDDTATWLGLDAHALYGATGSNEELRANLVEPHDSCTILAQETNGTVFTSNKWNKIVQEMSKVIGVRVSQPSCKFCECQIEEYNPITVCYPCDVPRPVSLTTGSSDKFFNIPYLKLRKTAEDAFDNLFM